MKLLKDFLFSIRVFYYNILISLNLVSEKKKVDKILLFTATVCNNVFYKEGLIEKDYMFGIFKKQDTFTIPNETSIRLSPIFLDDKSSPIKKLDQSPSWTVVECTDEGSSKALQDVLITYNDGFICIFTPPKPGLYRVDVLVDSDLTTGESDLIKSVFVFSKDFSQDEIEDKKSNSLTYSYRTLNAKELV